MTSSCQKYCLEAIQLADKLIKLSYDGNAGCDDDRCLGGGLRAVAEGDISKQLRATRSPGRN